MKGICIPLEVINGEERTEMELKSVQNNSTQYFRLEPLYLEENENDGARLKNYINSYSKEWELLQVFGGETGGNRKIYLLYRKQMKIIKAS